MKTTITFEYEKSDFNDSKVKELVNLAIAFCDDKIVCHLLIDNVENAIVYRNGDKILRIGDVVRHSNEFFLDRGVILPTPSDYFEGFVCIRWNEMHKCPPHGELGSYLTKV